MPADRRRGVRRLWPDRRFLFINFDDDEYVYENRDVRADDPARRGAVAFTRPHSVNWHPLTTLSHMLDCQLYGLWAGGHHLGNVVLHALTAAGLYLVLRQMTGRRRPYALRRNDLRTAPLEGRVGGLGRGTQGRAQRTVLHAHVGGLSGLCQQAFLNRSHFASAAGICARIDVQTDARDPPVSPLAPRLLAARKVGARGARRHSTPSSWRNFRSASSPPVRARSRSCFSDRPCPRCSRSLAQRFGNILLAYSGYWKLFFWPFGLAVYYPLRDPPPSWMALAARAAGLHYLCRLGLAKEIPLSDRRLALVPGHARAGHRPRPGRLSIHGRPLHLSADDWPRRGAVWLVADLAGQSVNRRFVFPSPPLWRCSLWPLAPRGGHPICATISRSEAARRIARRGTTSDLVIFFGIRLGGAWRTGKSGPAI